MKRRDFLLAASGVAGGTAATASAAAQETTTSGGGNQSGGNGTTGGNQTGGNGTAGNGTSGNNSSGNQSQGGGGGGPTKTVKVVDNAFEPQEISITPGTTVKWVWEGNGHNIVVQSQPSGSSWEGTKGGKSKLYDQGHTYTHTFETTGTYEYYCNPHKAVGMTGTITVGSGGGGGGGAEEEADPEEMGVAFQAHFVGIATILMMIVSLIYTFFFLKYGESAHTSGGGQ